MEIRRVKSSLLLGVGYDPEKQVCRIVFLRKGDDTHYDYGFVTQEEFDAFVNAESVGKHFLAHFKNNPAHPWTKIEKPKESLPPIIEEEEPEKVA